ncbi:hypothetical protein FRC00_005935, partial [Tulasnella sp. 408]
MTFGTKGMSGVRTSDPRECQELLNLFFTHGHKEVDTARVYGDGTTEVLLSKMILPQEATIDTKVLPSKPGDHAPHNLRRVFEGSLTILSPHKVRVLYLHRPDSDIFGLSNYAAWEVAEIVGICEKYGYVRPRIYQAMYNPITRAIEAELIPCLRKFGIRLVIYNPLAGGFFAGKLTSPDDTVEKGTRFDGATRLGKMYQERYFRPAYFEALEKIKAVADKHGLRLTEIALRWCQHHSELTAKDGVIIGATSAKQLEENCSD